MKRIASIILFLILGYQLCYGQDKGIPKNIRQAVRHLQTDCTDSLKTLIKKTSDEKLFEISYPGNGQYKTIYNWLSDKNVERRISEYLIDKGVTYFNHQTEIILLCFKKSLLNQPINEKTILKPYQTMEAKWAKEDTVRFTTDSLRGIYIPKDIEDCFRQIDRFWSDSTKEEVKSWSEDDFTGKAHFGFGRWMRNNWSLWGGSRLSKYFNQLGIYQAEDMSGIILTSYHRYLLGKDLKLNDQVIEYKKYWAKAKTDDSLQKVKEFAAYHVGDTLNFHYKLDYVSKEQEFKADQDICHAKGVVTAKDDTNFWLKVRIIETCDKKGIIIYDNDGTVEYNKRLKRFTEPKKRIIKKGFVYDELWFNYDAWEPKDN